MIYLALGSNLGNRFENLRKAISELGTYFQIKQVSHVTETEALLLPGSPESWNIPYLNMMLAGDTDLSPQELLKKIKETEKKIGRDMTAPRWSPRIIDIDIVLYHQQHVSDDNLKIPHIQIPNRDFWKYLLETLGYETGDASVNDYDCLNYFVLDPKFVKIINVTPDSFSDGGKCSDPEVALKEIEKAYKGGAAYVELGAQSTRPGYKEVSAEEEIRRLEPVVKEVSHEIPLAVDSYFDEVVEFCAKHANVQMINDIKGGLSKGLLMNFADKKIVTMMQNVDWNRLKQQVENLKELGIKNIVVDPGIGFGKSKFENLKIIREAEKLKKFGCEILIGHSRKSFMQLFTKAAPQDRDIETLAISDALDCVDYLRVHNLEAHMKFFTAKLFLNQGVVKN